MTGIAIFLATVTLVRGAINASALMHRRLLHNVLMSPMQFFESTPVGRLVNRFSKDVDAIDVQVPMNFQYWLMCFFRVVATLIVLSATLPLILTVAVPIAIVYYLVQVYCPRVLNLFAPLHS